MDKYPVSNGRLSPPGNLGTHYAMNVSFGDSDYYDMSGVDIHCPSISCKVDLVSDML